MNIAIMIPELGGGGAEKVAQQLGNHFIDRGDHVYYFVLNTQQKRIFSVKGEIVQTGLISCVVGAKGIKDVFLRLLIGAKRIRALKKQYKIDVSISFMEECNYLNILSQRGEKVIVRICTILSQRQDLNPWLYDKRLVHGLYSLPCKIVFMSHYARNDMAMVYRIPRKKIDWIPNAIDKPLQRKMTAAREHHCVVAVGRLDPVKQHDRILRAFSDVVNQVKEARLLLVGTGANERYLKGLCRRYGITEHVEFLGFQRDVKPYLEMASVFVMASAVEGFPNSMIEAMAFGVPVVTTDSPGGCADILGKKIEFDAGYWLCQYGILTPRISNERVHPEDPLTKEEHILGKALTAVLKDEAIRNQYTAASEERAKNYSGERIFSQWDRLVSG